jgi:NTE family protein
MDGGIRSLTNADLAWPADTVLVIAPLGYGDGNPVSGHLRAEVAYLRERGVAWRSSCLTTRHARQ